MSLNKLTQTTQKGLDLSLKIGADELKCNTLNAGIVSFDSLIVDGLIVSENLNVANLINVDDIKVNSVVAQSLQTSNELKAGDLEYPTSINLGVPFQYVGSIDGSSSLSLVPSTGSASYGYARANGVGAPVPISNFGSFTEPNTAGNLYSLPSNLYTDHPQGINILVPAIYKITATLRVVRSVIDESNYCAILKNGSSTQQALQVCPSIANNADIAFSITDYMLLAPGDRVSVGIAGLAGGTVAFEYWKLDIEYIR